ncbi:hypothetical protein [Tropicimonas sp. IMCC6043]|uniref:hypothetical protein n=1 Tax=Tropicimonas sp. IMCC6043 TaxID=2510645 RepID=UPI0013EC3DD4|nr:hypothetical protein [Tropicimonas sp. IMCC6043]
MRVNDLEHLLKPVFRGAILQHPQTVALFGAFEWSSRQFMELRLMEPGQWF